MEKGLLLNRLEVTAGSSVTAKSSFPRTFSYCMPAINNSLALT